MTAGSKLIPGAAIFECRTCDGSHVYHRGWKVRASRYQVHRVASAGLLICDGCAQVREILREGEAIPVAVSRWPDLPHPKGTYGPH